MSSSTTTTTTTTKPPMNLGGKDLRLSRRIHETLDPCVQLMADIINEYVDLWSKKGGICNLSQGIVYWKPPPSAINFVKSVIEEDEETATPDSNTFGIPLHIYSPNAGLSQLCDVLQDELKNDSYAPLTNHRVMITAGANQAYVNCILALLDEQHKAVLFQPYYFNHVMTLQMCAGEESLLIGPSLTQPQHTLGWPDLEWLEAQLQSADNTIRVVTLVNPGNPTGTSLSREHLQRAVDVTRKYGCWLILDCTYRDFVHDVDDDTASGETTTTGQGHFEGCFDHEPHVIHIFSFSKSHGMAGYRCGYLALHNDVADTFAQINKVQDCIAIGVSRLSQVAAMGALKAGKPWVREQVATLATGRRAILQALTVGLGLEERDDASSSAAIMGGAGSMYVMAKLSWTEDDIMVAKQLVKEYGVAIIPGSFCGAPGWIRVCYANLPPQKCVEAAQRLQTGLESLRKK